MPDLLRLSLRAIDLATLPTRFVLGKLLDLRHSDDDQVAPMPAAEAPAPAPAAPVAEAPPKPRPRPEPPQSAKPKPRAKATPKPSPKAARRATRNEPTKGQAGEIRLQEHMAEQDAGGPGPGATLDVQAPWDDYDAMTEDQVLDRLTGADQAVRAIVRLYEGSHGERRQIMIATEGVGADL